MPKYNITVRLSFHRTQKPHCIMAAVIKAIKIMGARPCDVQEFVYQATNGDPTEVAKKWVHTY